MHQVCKQCGTSAEPTSDTPGSILIELVLWLCFIVPGLIYSLWRHSKRRDVCRACHSPDLVPRDSPIGRQLAAALPPEPVYRGSAEAESFGRTLGRAVRYLIPKKKR
jgi:hypothetical protein